MQEKIKTENFKEAMRFLKWLSENPAIKEAICLEDEPNPEECLQIIIRLEKEAFYDMLLIFMLRQNHRSFMAKVCNEMVMDELMTAWEKEEPDKICQKIKILLRQTISETEKEVP